MPELPEVETTKRGIEHHICGQTIEACVVRNPKLRWPVAAELCHLPPGLVVKSVSRRAKYLLIETQAGHIIIHLGMSGHLRILSKDTPLEKHDHIDLVFNNGVCLRYHDPRRFGAWLWTNTDPHQHPLLAKLAPEPLTDAFNGENLFEAIKHRPTAIKALIMNNQYVVGVGNIYANESLFLAGIHPLRPAKRLTQADCDRLVRIIKQVLSAAIDQGGTTLKDFMSPSGKPGYFVQKLYVYDRANQACLVCQTPIQREVHLQRASYICPHCQPA
ncbi:bifunctional DNA-formamidopyrimidine glycosylase/DNA-(apurinic or apyrimidinic site) lyase [Thiomicrospira microaerophila]|uniref:bifunctional DNA-formamidopyrimidine glycosylase/DNA-(apurinic or apyrimidinic site) lyase n=1 Tax=Thiomicrospira microaerophila TaxID=406020 RepID=UPI0005CA1DDA|nr:bifunctional DNA-formamidopyrimidine glycosylase/DNA-(apurinic or apyrimidinic site) lyase [Thiomicrospira microaerophila]